ncbi:cell division protein FtsI [Microbacterium terricola]|uniref:Cell division protein FtsI n=1 Tax=Microbacterium terricola TaxID=344163 RepID=A0ABM8DXV4_9MICO|nr:cell division protein FtsI [Microbacterium terricola]
MLAGFIVRLVDIQVVNAEEHIEDSMENALAGGQTLYGARGSIVDAGGNLLAGSILQYDCQLDPLLITQIDADIIDGTSTADPWSTVSVQIAEITGQKVEKVQQIVADTLAEDPDSRFVYLDKGVDTEVYRGLADLGAPYLVCLSHPARSYPDGAVAGNLVGFVSSDGEALAGLEVLENDCLTPTNGKQSYQRGKDGVIIPGTEVRQEAADGGTVQLTIDNDLQWYMQQLIAEQGQNMKAKSGSIMVYEVATGKIRAAAEWPSVDPNEPGEAKVRDRASRIFTNWFEPGSTFKALTAATVIDAGGQTPQSSITASGSETFPNGARVRDSFAHPAYNYTLAGVLIDSSNVGISKFSEKVSAKTRYTYLKKFGIGDGSSVNFLGEQNGLIYPVEEWGAQTTYNTSYGQGLTTTLPELVGAYGAIANDGVRLPLQLVESCTKADGSVVKPELPEPVKVVSASTAEQVREIIGNVATQSTNAKRIKIEGYNIGVKTGTGEKINDAGTGYKAGAYFTTMIGMAPLEDPQYIVAVTLDEPSRIKSSAANASAWQKAMTQVLKTYRVMPSTTDLVKLAKFAQ